jgi:hypothetical protein
MKNNHNTGIKLIYSGLFFLIILALVVIWENPSQGYELSIYSSTPVLFFILIISAILGGVAVVVYSIITRDVEKDSSWRMGLFLVVLGHLVIILLPTLRGYVYYGLDDNLTHLSWVNLILQEGDIGLNIYPITHIAIAQVSYITKTSSQQLMHLAGPLFYLMFITFMYLFCNQILPKKAAILGTLSATVLFLVFFVQVRPWGFAATFIPLILFLIYRVDKQTTPGLIFILLVLVGILPVFHLITSTFIIGILIVLLITHPLSKKIFGDESNLYLVSPKLISLFIFILVGVSVLWMWNNLPFWQNSMAAMYKWYLGEITRPDLADTSFIKNGLASAEKLGLDIPDLVRTTMLTFGHVSLYLLVGLTTFIMLVSRRFTLSFRESRILFSLSIALGLITFLGLLNYFVAISLLNSSDRILDYIYPLLFLLVGLGLFKIINYGKKGYPLVLRALVVTSIISVCILIGIFEIFPSPLVHQQNSQMSKMELSGVNWFINARNPRLQFTEIADVILPPLESVIIGMNEEDYPLKKLEWLGNHFNYDKNQTFGETINENLYLIINRYSRSVYIELWPTGRFTWNDFDLLEEDPTVNRIYDNGEAQNYYVTH